MKSKCQPFELAGFSASPRQGIPCYYANATSYHTIPCHTIRCQAILHVLYNYEAAKGPRDVELSQARGKRSEPLLQAIPPVLEATGKVKSLGHVSGRSCQHATMNVLTYIGTYICVYIYTHIHIHQHVYAYINNICTYHVCIYFCEQTSKLMNRSINN